jgi:hypothetical protein
MSDPSLPRDSRPQAVSRRSILKGAATVASGLPLVPFSPARATETDSPGQEGNAGPPWYAHAWRRAVIDMHIPDWDPLFLSRFDPDQYVARLVQSRAQSIVLYAQSHVGLFNYPTKVGRQHAAWKGRDILRELIDRVHARQIAVQLYTSLIFDRWASDQHEDWRIRQSDGSPIGVGSRFGLVCPNSPYRDYVAAWAREVSQRYDFEGIRFDMTFWPAVCYCRHCRRRWEAEVGGEMPRTINWLDERWVAFQRKREAWLADFAALATRTVKEVRPRATVEHQASTLPGSWAQGATELLVAQNDFLQGDFYGDALQGSFVRKLLEELTPHRPFGFETSYALALNNHTTGKAEALLEAKASAAIADSAAFIFIDAIDPIGTVKPRAHARMGRVFDRLMPCYAHLGGERVADVAVYYGLQSKFSFRTSGQPADSQPGSDTHTPAAMQATRWLLAAHLPVAVITKKSLPRLDRYRVLVLANVNMMDAEEVEAIRRWVQAGGSLYASGASSLVTKQGRLQNDFLLADVLGISLRKADWGERLHYIAPTPAGQTFFPEHDATYPAMDTGYTLDITARPGAGVLATTSWPWPAPAGNQFASIHSNPPWTGSDRPEIVASRFGQGRAIYCASLVETVPGLDATFLALIRSLHDGWSWEADAPPVVEATVFHQADRRRYLVSLVNFQKDLPNVPVDGAVVRLRPGDRRVEAVRLLPSRGTVAHRQERGVVSFTVPRFETLAMLAVEYA